MNYEKAYRNALERAREELGSGSYNKGTIEYIFPELKESEDEKNIKNLIDELKCSLRAANCQNEACNGGHEKRIALLEWAIAWLEKQVEQKLDNKIEPTDYNSIDPHFGKPIGKIEPKFKVGDWIVNRGHSYLIADIDYSEQRYLFEIGGYTHEQLNWEYIELADKRYHLWTIRDAKDGDLLVSQYNKPFIYNGNFDSFNIGSYCGISIDDRFNVATEKCYWTENVNIYPATKEQRDTLFAKMKEAGYEWGLNKE